jgi:hypothetical protein
MDSSLLAVKLRQMDLEHLEMGQQAAHQALHQKDWAVMADLLGQMDCNLGQQAVRTESSGQVAKEPRKRSLLQFVMALQTH